LSASKLSLQRLIQQAQKKTVNYPVDIDILLSACIFPVFFWAFYDFFNQFPSYILGYSVTEIVGIASYNLSFALLESFLFFVIILLILYLVAVILPNKLLGDHLAVIGSGLAIWVAGVAMFIQKNYLTVIGWSSKTESIYLSLVVLGFLIYWAFVIHYPKFKSVLRSIYKRLVVLSAIYAVFGMAGFIVVILRNIIN
jgi:hypothetical protein